MWRICTYMPVEARRAEPLIQARGESDSRRSTIWIWRIFIETFQLEWRPFWLAEERRPPPLQPTDEERLQMSGSEWRPSRHPSAANIWLLWINYRRDTRGSLCCRWFRNVFDRRQAEGSGRERASWLRGISSLPRYPSAILPAHLLWRGLDHLDITGGRFTIFFYRLRRRTDLWGHSEFLLRSSNGSTSFL